jgi:hypothetical protein
MRNRGCSIGRVCYCWHRAMTHSTGASPPHGFWLMGVASSQKAVHLEVHSKVQYASAQRARPTIGGTQVVGADVSAPVSLVGPASGAETSGVASGATPESAVGEEVSGDTSSPESHAVAPRSRAAMMTKRVISASFPRSGGVERALPHLTTSQGGVAPVMGISVGTGIFNTGAKYVSQRRKFW